MSRTLGIEGHVEGATPSATSLSVVTASDLLELTVVTFAPNLFRSGFTQLPSASTRAPGTTNAETTVKAEGNAVKTMEKSAGTRLLVGEAAASSDLAIGTHLVTERVGYTHHGVYAGAGKVVHYAGLSRSLRRGPVEEVTLADFADGCSVWIQHSPGAKYTGEEATCRAYSRLGEDRYHLVSNNCEHFCAWCLYGESRSEQIDVWKNRAIDVLGAAIKALKQLPVVASKCLCTRNGLHDSDFGATTI